MFKIVLKLTQYIFLNGYVELIQFNCCFLFPFKLVIILFDCVWRLDENRVDSRVSQEFGFRKIFKSKFVLFGKSNFLASFRIPEVLPVN